MIVELLDYRPSKSNEPELEQPERTRVVLTPNDESRWADIWLMSKKATSPWSDAEALQVEARMLVRMLGVFVSAITNDKFYSWPRKVHCVWNPMCI